MTKIIAEIGQNYDGSLENAIELIKLAKLSGADIAKFQIFNPVEIFTEEDNPWWEYNLANELSKDDVSKLNAECVKQGIEFMASVFDLERLQWVLDLGVKRVKIASRSINDQQLIEASVESGKEVIISLGHWNGSILPYQQHKNVRHLHCISKYPTELAEINLRGVDFSSVDGFSDHSIGVTASVYAMCNGARLIEKHFTDDQTKPGPDHGCSATPEEMAFLCKLRDELSLMS